MGFMIYSKNQDLILQEILSQNNENKMIFRRNNLCGDQDENAREMI